MEKSLSKKKIPFHLNYQRFYLLLISCFAFPIFVTAFFGVRQVDGQTVFLSALLSGVLGGVVGWTLLQQWEKRMKRAVQRLAEERCDQLNVLPSDQLEGYKKEFHKARLSYEYQIDLLHSSVEKSKEQVNELNLEMDNKLEEMRLAYLEFEDLRQEYTRLEEEYGRYKGEVVGQLKHKDSLLADYQHTITEQRAIIEKKQLYITKLEGKVRDLMYEIRSLLQIEDPLLEQIPIAKEEEPVPTSGKKVYDHAMQLSRYLDMAEEFTGADHLGGRFLDSSANQYAIDLRPLFDRLCEETGGILFVYSQFENKFLFANKMVKTLLGWSSEKFMKDFHSIVEIDASQWQCAISELADQRVKKIRLISQVKGGGERPLDCNMGVITKGPFANYIIGIMLG
ncbi:MAG: hypothetical protein S4CHLAM45_10360 [Chlamydiales bacterium]|nr:hypothetical protein [Chlamydiales bacterium]MCH9619530.1 hypothetical protein [Chlamydiales bacterium]MCH9623136.1 hypothetical protein [Chlamydiales bacterium]